jgi:hypothetical protein
VYYDHIIRKEIPDGEFVSVSLIGNILGKHPLGKATGGMRKESTR